MTTPIVTAGIDPEFLVAMENVLDVWISGPHALEASRAAKENLAQQWPALAAALDRLAALNA